MESEDKGSSQSVETADIMAAEPKSPNQAVGVGETEALPVADAPRTQEEVRVGSNSQEGEDGHTQTGGSSQQGQDGAVETEGEASG